MFDGERLRMIWCYYNPVCNFTDSKTVFRFDPVGSTTVCGLSGPWIDLDIQFISQPLLELTSRCLLSLNYGCLSCPVGLKINCASLITLDVSETRKMHEVCILLPLTFYRKIQIYDFAVSVGNYSMSEACRQIQGYTISSAIKNLINYNL